MQVQEQHCFIAWFVSSLWVSALSHFLLLLGVLFVLVSVAQLMTKTIISQSIRSLHINPIYEAPKIYLMNIVCAFLSPC